MEAPIKSGALITASFANDFCRDVYVLPGSLDTPQSMGCLDLLNRGAQVILSEEHLLEMLGTMPQLDLLERAPVKERPQPQLEPKLNRVFQVLNDEAIAIDAIAQKISLDPGQILAALSQLEIMDLVIQLPGMRYQRK